ncbi:MAG: class I SAM-dependent methyltransferase [Rhodobacteraceae bacterium]|nr:class I SAM-dependent methyltransferase [Paracoccaceae bacterium]
MEGLSDRQRSEIEYHQDFAAQRSHLKDVPFSLDVCESVERRWWNSYWSLYDVLATHPLKGKRVLVPGCGFGEDCARLSFFGADVVGIDLSPEIIEITQHRLVKFAKNATAAAMPCERLDFPDDYFDEVVLVNILHHVDIAKTMKEVRRVTKPGGIVAGLEMYTHSAVQKLRNNAVTEKIIYPLVKKVIYSGKDPYITPDERKVDQLEMRQIVSDLTDVKLDYFNILVGRIFSDSGVRISKFDRRLCKAMGGLSSILAGRVIFEGRKPS